MDENSEDQQIYENPEEGSNPIYENHDYMNQVKDGVSPREEDASATQKSSKRTESRSETRHQIPEDGKQSLTSDDQPASKQVEDNYSSLKHNQAAAQGSSVVYESLLKHKSGSSFGSVWLPKWFNVKSKRTWLVMITVVVLVILMFVFGFLCGYYRQATGTALADPMSPCPDGFVGNATDFSGSCYRYVLQTSTWPLARETCISAGGGLAEVNTESEMLHIFDLIVKEDHSGYDVTDICFWVGGQMIIPNAIISDFNWIRSADPLSRNSSLWQEGEPNNENGVENAVCLFVPTDNIDRLGLNDDKASAYHPVVCEFEL